MKLNVCERSWDRKKRLDLNLKRKLKFRKLTKGLISLHRRRNCQRKIRPKKWKVARIVRKLSAVSVALNFLATIAKYNPACQNCQSNDSSWDPDDPFSSFPSPSPPISLVTHWILPQAESPPQNPSLITSLMSHCAKFPNPGDSFISIEEALELLKKMFEEMRSSL